MMNLEVNHANPEQSFFGAENDTALPEDMRALALENAKGRIEHLLQFVSGNPGQSSFSAHFILEDKFHNQMHSDFLAELEKHSTVDTSEITSETTLSTTINDVPIFRVGHEFSVKNEGLWKEGFWVNAGIGGVTYFATRKDPTSLV